MYNVSYSNNPTYNEIIELMHRNVSTITTSWTINYQTCGNDQNKMNQFLVKVTELLHIGFFHHIPSIHLQHQQSPAQTESRSNVFLSNSYKHDQTLHSDQTTLRFSNSPSKRSPHVACSSTLRIAHCFFLSDEIERNRSATKEERETLLVVLMSRRCVSCES